MARVTVEDCLKQVPNRFALVLLAAHRTRQLMKGSRPTVEDSNAEAVIALREIASGTVRYDRPVGSVFSVDLIELERSVTRKRSED